MPSDEPPFPTPTRPATPFVAPLHPVRAWLACAWILCGACGGGSRAEGRPDPSPVAEPAPGPALDGTLHAVQAGDTLWSLAVRYHSSVDELREVNGLSEEDALPVGQVLFIPAPDPMAPAPSPGGPEEPWPERPAPPPPPTGNARFAWPLKDGVLFSAFGPRQGSLHDGIDLGAPEGTPVMAAADGEVIFAGENQGAFGHLVILKHAGDDVTVYAHNRKNLVKEGRRVQRGEVIAEVGASGEAQTPHVHFEIRVKRKPVNPEPLLPVE